MTFVAGSGSPAFRISSSSRRSASERVSLGSSPIRCARDFAVASFFASASAARRSISLRGAVAAMSMSVRIGVVTGMPSRRVISSSSRCAAVNSDALAGPDVYGGSEGDDLRHLRSQSVERRGGVVARHAFVASTAAIVAVHRSASAPTR